METLIDPRVRRPAEAWLGSYTLAQWLGFAADIARKHGDRARDRTVDQIQQETTERLN